MPISVYVLLFIILWGVGGVLVKKGFQKLSPWQTYALDAIDIALPMWLIYGLLTASQLKPVTPMAILSALFITFFYALYYYTISLGEIGLTSPIIASYPIFTLILALLFLNEHLTMIVVAGIIITSIGVILISLPKKIQFRLEKWVILSILVSIGYGIGGYLGKIAVSEVGNSTYLITLAISQVFIVLLWRIFTHEKFPPFNYNILKYSFWGILLFNLGNILFYVALEKGYASIIVPLSNTYITITVLLSIIWLKEKITIRQLIGIILVIAGVIIVGFMTHLEVRPNFESDPNGQQKPTNVPTQRQKAKVSLVLDGDTIEISDKIRVRLIGIDTPELKTKTNPPQCFAETAAKITRSLLENQTIEMEKDVSETDRYGRLLRYIYLDNILINEFLLSAGFARIETIPPDVKYYQLFLEAEKEARSFGRGLWKSCN